MKHVNAIDVAARLAVEFPGTGILGKGDTMTFTGPAAQQCRVRALELMRFAKLFNAHADVGHVGNRRNWWKRH